MESHGTIGITTANIEPIATAASEPLHGYGGWLKCFCILQIYVAPILFLTTFALNMASPSSRLPTGIGLVIFFGRLGVLGFGIRVAGLLRDLDPTAIKMVKAYLIATVIWHITSTVLGLPYSHSAFEVNSLILGIPVSIIKGALWYAYFNVSKRIALSFFPERA